MAFVIRASVLFSSLALTVNAEGFLKHDPRTTRHLVGRDENFQDAMASVMGCRGPGGHDVDSHLADVEQDLAPMWRVLPKDGDGRVQWKSMRYLTHRYFLKQSSLLVRGFEPARQVNDSHKGDADVFKHQVPSLVDTVLEGKRSTVGFSLNDAAVLVATIDRLMFNSERDMLETVYKYLDISEDEPLHEHEVHNLLESYIVHWMLQGADKRVIAMLLNDRKVLAQEIPHWGAVSDYLLGLIRSLFFARQRAPQVGLGKSLMSRTLVFDDVHTLVGSLTKTFASYWESECRSIKTSLTAIDKKGNGRVTLPDFYGANSEGEWRFGESEEYLRELGALDESARFSPKQVIIPNYVQGANNCIVTSDSYFVCCKSECEDILNEIEDTVGEPVASPEDILEPLKDITDLDDKAPKLTNELKSQLQRIADTHGGKVPLHGRLFAQWLHYVFPYECPFPHKVGTANFKAPKDYGADFIAHENEVAGHASQRNNTAWQTQAVEEERTFAQWSEDEELVADYSLHLRAPWEGSHLKSLSLIVHWVAALALLASGAIVSMGQPSQVSQLGNVGYEQKVHLV